MSVVTVTHANGQKQLHANHTIWSETSVVFIQSEAATCQYLQCEQYCWSAKGWEQTFKRRKELAAADSKQSIATDHRVHDEIR